MTLLLVIYTSASAQSRSPQLLGSFPEQQSLRIPVLSINPNAGKQASICLFKACSPSHASSCLWWFTFGFQKSVYRSISTPSMPSARPSLWVYCLPCLHLPKDTLCSARSCKGTPCALRSVAHGICAPSVRSTDARRLCRR